MNIKKLLPDRVLILPLVVRVALEAQVGILGDENRSVRRAVRRVAPDAQRRLVGRSLVHELLVTMTLIAEFIVLSVDEPRVLRCMRTVT